MTIASESPRAIPAQARPQESSEQLAADRPSVDLHTTRRWERALVRSVLLADAVAICLGVVGAQLARFGTRNHMVGAVTYDLISVGVITAWLLALAVSRAYQPRFFGAGAEEYKLVLNASARLTIGLLFVCYLLKLPLARGYLGLALPVGTFLLLVGRRTMRTWLRRRRASGWTHRVVAVGGAPQVAELARNVARDAHSGFQLVGACVPGGDDTRGLAVQKLPVLGSLATVIQAVHAADADTVMVTGGPGITGDALKRLSWSLEGTGIDLIVAPSLTDVGGPRISVRPVAGLPMLHLDEPDLSGPRWLMKTIVGPVLALLGLVLLAPVLAAVALAVRLTSPGPALFRQKRIGRDGEEFELLKFRSMYVDAEERKAALLEHNEYDAVMFKIRRDPRVTPVGRFIRRFSLDELPQLLNVVRGDMALIGPRPPLPGEFAQYADHVHRRLLVKPGLTGLWQVSGRSDLPWEEAVRLDLYYVENWSPALDMQILWRTLSAVVRGAGAY